MLQVINLSVHFLLELCALAAVVYWGFKTGNNGWEKFLLGTGISVLLAAIWGIFRVPNDPGPATIAVPGWVRIIIELGIFTFAAWAIWNTGLISLAWVFGIAIVVNYILMNQRLAFLISH